MSDGDETPDPTAETAYTKLSTKLKRGTGTRDQDTTKVVTRHPDPDQAVEKHAEALRAARTLTEDARTIQPGGGHDG